METATANEPSAPRRMSGELASDADRRAAVAELRAHCGAGRLTIDEFDARVGEAYDARTMADLVKALRDLPPPVASAPTPAPVVERKRCGSVSVSVPNLSIPDARTRASLAHKSYAVHRATYLAVIGMLVVIWLLTTPFGYFWPIWPAMGWGVGLVAHRAGARAVGAGRHH
jgi:hypothetical protein